MAKQPETESILDMLSRLGAQMKLPKVDIEAVLDHHGKNLEALEKAAKAGAAGASSVLAKQREMLKDTFREVADLTRDFQAGGDARQLASKQAEFARRSFEAAVRNAGEVAETVKKSGTESIDILRERIRESMKEIRAAFDDRQ
jgi:phasin family protein